MTSSIRILTTSGLDSNPSLLLVSPTGSKTLINCGEGCQRAFLESSSLGPNINVGSLRVSSVNRVCLTHVGHDAFGGLPGMILTTADVAESAAKNFQRSQEANRENNNKHQQQRAGLKRDGSLISDNGNEGIPDLEVLGPVGTKAFLHSLRHFMRRDRFNVHVHEGNFDSSKCNNAPSGKSVPKKKAKKAKSDPSSNDDIEFTVKSIPIDYTVQDTNNECITKQAVSYTFTTPPIPGKFLVQKANELKIPRGPMYSHLKAGKSVTFTDPDTNEERTVTPEEVLAEGSGGIGAVVLYCPNSEVLDKLKQSDALQSVLVGTSNNVDLDAVVHLTPKRFFQTDEYQAWCRTFGSNMEHILLHVAETLEDRLSDATNSPFVSAMRGAVRRSLANSSLFPMPKLIFESDNSNDIDGVEANSNCTLKTIYGCPMMEYVLLPRSRRGVNELTTKPIYTKDDFDSLKTNVSESGAVDLGKEIAASHINIKTINKLDEGNCASRAHGELIFTGTGSALPCKHRNVTGMYLRMHNGNGILLDVGEGTIGQLLHSWRSSLDSDSSLIDEYHSRIKGIKAVWISHPHADHHLGLLRLLSERTSAGAENDPIVIMAPPNMFAFLSEYQSVVPETSKSYIAVDARDIKEGFQIDDPTATRLLNNLGITHSRSVTVAHCPNSFAIVLDGTSFGKVAYSGDCRPSNRFAAAARGADLLIHEATFEDGMEEEAVLKRHSTVGEAIDVAIKMEAKSLILTHFSQRYPKIPRLNLNSTTPRGMHIAIAFDFMTLSKESIHLASKLTPALRLLYPDDASADEVNDNAGMKESDHGNTTAKDLMSVPGVFAAKDIL